MLNLLFLLSTVHAHSWVHCTDYRGDLGNYESSQCFGHIRPLRGSVPEQITPFGQDYGFDHKASGADQCHSSETQPAAYPMAQYTVGQTVTLAWPAKNHAAASCTNQYIPDTKLELYVASGFESNSFTQVIDDASWVREPHVNGQIDFKGFQNCPNFCGNTDKSLCTGNFVVPNLPPGEYTFQWRWQFNAGDASPYTTCFQAMVGGGGNNGNNSNNNNNNNTPDATTAPPATTATPAGPTVPSFPNSDHLSCVPHPDEDPQRLFYAMDWACNSGESGMDCNDAPANCQDGEKIATWAFSKYYALFEKSGGTCEFSGTAYLSDQIKFIECVYEYEEAPETTQPPPVTRAPVTQPPANGGTTAPVYDGSGTTAAPVQDSRICVPKMDVNDASGPVWWTCGDDGIDKGIDCTTAPAPCQSGRGRATYAFSQYYMKYYAAGANCDFDGYAELKTSPDLPHCVFGYTGVQPQIVITPSPTAPVFPGMDGPGGNPTPPNGNGDPAPSPVTNPEDSSDEELIFGYPRNTAILICAGAAGVLIALCCSILVICKCCCGNKKEVVVVQERRGRKKRRRKSGYEYRRYSTQV